MIDKVTEFLGKFGDFSVARGTGVEELAGRVGRRSIQGSEGVLIRVVAHGVPVNKAAKNTQNSEVGKKMEAKR